jgi:FkbM family methyltransferase
MPDEIAPVLQNLMEPQCAEELVHLHLAGSSVLDVGASYGYYALMLAKLVGPTGRVYSCDPDADSFARLTCNLALNRVLNVIGLPLCIADGGEGLRPWLSFAEAPWNNRLALGGLLEKTVPDRVVAVSSVDQVAQALGIVHDVRLIKIDVEGAEGLVLEGARAVLDRSKPAILCEVHGSEAGERVFAVLRQHSYSWRRIDAGSDSRYHVLALPHGSDDGPLRLAVASVRSKELRGAEQGD